MPDKWEREIEELLQKKFPEGDKPSQQQPAPRPLKRREPQPRGRRPWWVTLQSMSAERLMLYGLGLAVVAYLFRPFFGPLTMLLILLSVSLIVGAVVISIVRKESPYVEKRWRGQVVELPQQRGPFSSLLRKLRRWLSGRG